MTIINGFPVIETERLILRRITLKDRQELLDIYSDEDVMRFYGIYPVTELETVENLILDYEDGYIGNSSIRWGIEIKETEQVIGTCGFHNFFRMFAKCEMGYELNKNFWNKGYMKEALIAIIEYAFNFMGMNRIEAQVYPENIPSFYLLEKMGFTKEGLLRECAYFRDKFQDLFMYSILKKDAEISQLYEVNDRRMVGNMEYSINLFNSNLS